MTKMNTRHLFVLMFALILLTGCAQAAPVAEMTATQSSAPSATIAPSSTVTAISETITPSATPEPENTPTPYKVAVPTLTSNYQFVDLELSDSSILYEKPDVKSNVIGLQVDVDYVLVASLDAQPAERYLENYLYAPDLWDQAATMVEIHLRVTNTGSAELFEQLGGSLVVVYDQSREKSEVILLRDLNGSSDNGWPVNPYFDKDILLEPGETLDYFWQIPVAKLKAEEIGSIDFFTSCPAGPNPTSVCYNTNEYYTYTVQVRLRNGVPATVGPDQIAANNFYPIVPPIERGGLKLSVDRIFFAPRDAFPRWAEMAGMDENAHTILFVLFSVENAGKEPIQMPLRAGFVSVSGNAASQNDLPDGINFQDARQLSTHDILLVLHQGETVRLPFLAGMPQEIGDGDKIEFNLPCVKPYKEDVSWNDIECISDEFGDDFSIKMTVSDRYEPFDLSRFPGNADPSYRRPINRHVELLNVSSPEQPCEDKEAIRQALLNAIPEDRRGVKFLLHQSNPAEWEFYAVTSGITGYYEIPGRLSPLTGRIDAALVYYLDEQGELHSVWLATSLQYPDNAEYILPLVYKPFNLSHSEISSLMSESGQLLGVHASDWYVDDTGVHWERCNLDGEYTNWDVCDFGAMLMNYDNVQNLPRMDDLHLFGWSISVEDTQIDVCRPSP